MSGKGDMWPSTLGASATHLAGRNPTRRVPALDQGHSAVTPGNRLRLREPVQTPWPGCCPVLSLKEPLWPVLAHPDPRLCNWVERTCGSWGSRLLRPRGPEPAVPGLQVLDPCPKPGFPCPAHPPTAHPVSKGSRRGAACGSSVPSIALLQGTLLPFGFRASSH